jgi:hypothetical protein
MRCLRHTIWLACAITLLACTCASAGELKELPPSCAPTPALKLLNFPAQWLHAGLPELNILERRVRVFGADGRRPAPKEGYTALTAQTDGLPDPSLEMTAWFAQRGKQASPLSERFDEKVAEFNRKFAMSADLLSPGIAELRDDIIPPRTLPYISQIALLNHSGAEMEMLDVALEAYFTLGKNEFLLELKVSGMDKAGYEQLRNALRNTLLEAASL